MNVTVFCSEVDSENPRYDATLDRLIKSTTFSIERVSSTTTVSAATRVANHFLSNDDTYALWGKDLKRRLASDSTRFDQIIITVPPFSTTALLHWLKDRSDAEITIDFRDAWSQWNISPFASPLHYKLVLQRERAVLEKADCVWVTNKEVKSQFSLLHSVVDQSKIKVVSNSFDEFLTECDDKLIVSAKSRIKIGYYGEFYYTPERRRLIFSKWYQRNPWQMLQYVPKKEDWLYRSPYFFFLMISKAIEQSSELSFEVNIASEETEWLHDMIESLHLENSVNVVGRLEKDQVREFIQSNDYMLLTASKNLKGKDYSVAGKTYEYFSFLKPILACCPDSVQKDILEASGISLTLDPDDVDDSAKTLCDLARNGTSFTPNYNYLNSYLTSNVFSSSANI